MEYRYYPSPPCSAATMINNGLEINTCTHCCSQWRCLDDQKEGNRLIYANDISKVEAEQLLDDYVASSKADHDFMRAHLPIHGDVVLTRWKNKGKTRQKRVALLQAALPGMHQTKHLTTRFFYEQRFSYNHPADRSAWLLPWLSVEALLEDVDNILHLLHTRTVHHGMRCKLGSCSIVRILTPHGFVLASRFSTTRMR